MPQRLRFSRLSRHARREIFAPYLVQAAAVAIAVLCLLLPRLAQAQVAVTITNPMSLARLDANGNGVTKRIAIAPEGINLQDCRDNLQLVFPITVTGFSSANNFEVWGTDQTAADCTVATARTGATQTCYQINANFSRTATQSLPIGIKELIKGFNATDVGADGCRRINQFTINVFFLVLSGTTVAGSAMATFTVDTVGPSAVANLKVLPGNQALTAQWDAVGEAGVDDVIGAQAFCDPHPIAVTATDAGSTLVCTDEAGTVRTDVDASDPVSLADAGVSCADVPNEAGLTTGAIPTSDAGFSSNGLVCETVAFAPVNGVPPVADNALIAKYGCGSIEGAQGSAIRVNQIAGVTPNNGTVYAVAIAATDSFGNLGDLSPPICQYPEATSDFWRDYRSSGGTSGGGFCAVEGPGFPAGSFGLLAIGFVVGVSSARRIQRRIKRRRNGR